jgi:RNA polymerase sigma factor (sigma-70 family)
MTDSAEPVDRYFPKTSWTLLAEARGEAAGAVGARDEFARRYYRPVYEYICAMLRDREEAEELAQGFFADIVVSGRLLARVDRERGSFRPYLKQAVRNYFTTQIRTKERQKRRPAEELRPDEWSGQGWERLDLATGDSPDAAFHEAFVRSLLEEAFRQVRAICEERGHTEHLRLFVGRYLSDSADPPSWRELGDAFGLDEKAARGRAETVARHFREVLRRMLNEENEDLAALLAML